MSDRDEKKSAMVKVVYNACHGGFGLSEAAVLRYAELKGLALYPEPDMGFVTYWLVPESQRLPEIGGDWYKMSIDERVAYNAAHKAMTLDPGDIPRTDPALVQVVEELGDEANTRFSELKATEVEAGARYRIDEYDGAERVMRVDDYEWEVAHTEMERA